MQSLLKCLLVWAFCWGEPTYQLPTAHCTHQWMKPNDIQHINCHNIYRCHCSKFITSHPLSNLEHISSAHIKWRQGTHPRQVSTWHTPFILQPKGNLVSPIDLNMYVFGLTVGMTVESLRKPILYICGENIQAQNVPWSDQEAMRQFSYIIISPNWVLILHLLSLKQHISRSYSTDLVALSELPRSSLSYFTQVGSGPQFNTSQSHKDTFFTSYWSRNIFITLSGVSDQAESVERRAEGERGHVEPDRDTGMTLWHVRIPSTELCLAQQHETRKWATNASPDAPSYSNVYTHIHTQTQTTTCSHSYHR